MQSKVYGKWCSKHGTEPCPDDCAAEHVLHPQTDRLLSFVQTADANPERQGNGCMIYRVGA